MILDVCAPLWGSCGPSLLLAGWCSLCLSFLELGYLCPPLCQPFLPAFLYGKPSYNHTVCSDYCRDKDALAKGTSDNGMGGQIGVLLSHEGLQGYVRSDRALPLAPQLKLLWKGTGH